MKALPYQYHKKKQVETWVLNTARSISTLIPSGDVESRESPDFLIQTQAGAVGVEIGESLCPAGEDGIKPVQRESFHKTVVKLAEEEYYSATDVKHVFVWVYFRRHGNLNKRAMANDLAKFVKVKVAAGKLSSFMDDLPDGFSTIHIGASSREWVSLESAGYTVSDVYNQLSSLITDKNKLLPQYRVNVPNTPMWLLLWTGTAVFAKRVNSLRHRAMETSIRI